MIESSPLEEAMASVGDATVPDEAVALELPDRLRPEGSDAELRYLVLVGLFDLLAEASLGSPGSDAEREDLLSRCLAAARSAEPVLRFARYERSTSVEALERTARMRGRDIEMGEDWLIPRLEADIAAYRARIDSLREWGRLRGWIESAREDIRLHTRLSAAASEWLEAGRRPDYLLTGERLSQVEAGIRSSSIRLTEREREYLEASGARAVEEATLERQRQEREARLERRAVARLRVLVAVLAVASLVAASLTVVAVNRSREAERRRVDALLSAEHEMAARLSAASLASLDTHPEMSLRLALYSIDVTASLGEAVPTAAIEGIHWALQEAGVQYPVSDAPVVVVDGPLGVFDLPLPALLTLAREHAGPPLSAGQCRQHFGTNQCPSLPSAFPATLAAMVKGDPPGCWLHLAPHLRSQAPADRIGRDDHGRLPLPPGLRAFPGCRAGRWEHARGLRRSARDPRGRPVLAEP